MKNSKTQGNAHNIGVDVKVPSNICNDNKCPFHGILNIKKRTFICTVTSSKPQKTAVVTWSRKFYIPKFERYEIRRTKISVHNPPCIDAKEKEIVKIIETRPISKTKNFVIVEKIGVDKKIAGEDVTLKEESENTKMHPEKAENLHEKPKKKNEE